VASYLAALTVLVAVWLDTGLVGRDLSTGELVLFLVAAVPAGFLLFFSLTSLATYFLFMPSVKEDSHVFSRVHGTHLIHPLTTAVVLGLLALCVLTGSAWGFAAWVLLFAVYTLQTALILQWVSKEHVMNGPEGNGPGKVLLLLHLILGGELVTVAAGARPLPPWKLKNLPEDTWIVDVRTKPEYHWNRIQAAENYPWGSGVVEAARNKPKDRPVVVTCFSGHRSPAVAWMLTRLGFETVYNLNWGLLYLVVLERGKKNTGPFSLTRPHRDAHRRGEDVRSISHGYITCALLTLICAPIENIVFARPVTVVHQIVGGLLGLGGLVLGGLSFHGLGRNFRVYAAPRRSGTLVDTGVYAWIRHPMYIGVVMALAGYVVAWDAYLSAIPLAACAALYVLKSVKEEHLLVEKFPEYEAYRKRTWKFIPFVY
jgi:protein-S-isoprenylcysteine O-methyltransferase Ste14/rhodanese-related sulfurtransferase